MDCTGGSGVLCQGSRLQCARLYISVQSPNIQGMVVLSVYRGCRLSELVLHRRASGPSVVLRLLSAACSRYLEGVQASQGTGCEMAFCALDPGALSCCQCMIVVTHSHPWFLFLVVITVYLSWAGAIGMPDTILPFHFGYHPPHHGPRPP
ncbi:hypothetical protein CPB85DRAFT_549243 [Mucidula mucida]|nr:hypothetical protein CPB85DRAFT_549243 [Mucidula mucida]